MKDNRVHSRTCSKCGREHRGEHNWHGHKSEYTETGTEGGSTKWRPLLCPDCFAKLLPNEKTDWPRL